jgi:hypothetical protein
MLLSVWGILAFPGYVFTSCFFILPNNIQFFLTPALSF